MFIQVLILILFVTQSGKLLLRRLDRSLELIRSGHIAGAAKPVLDDIVQRPRSMPALRRATHGAHTTVQARITRARFRRRNTDHAHSALNALQDVPALHFRHICWGGRRALALARQADGRGGCRWRSLHVFRDMLNPQVPGQEI